MSRTFPAQHHVAKKGWTWNVNKGSLAPESTLLRFFHIVWFCSPYFLWKNTYNHTFSKISIWHFSPKIWQSFSAVGNSSRVYSCLIFGSFSLLGDLHSTPASQTLILTTLSTEQFLLAHQNSARRGFFSVQKLYQGNFPHSRVTHF